LKTDLIALGARASGHQSRSTSIVDTTVDDVSQNLLHATYEFPRVVLFMDEQILEPSGPCQKALEAIRVSPSADAVLRFMDKFGHVYAKEVHLGGRLQCTKSLESVSGASISQKREALKAEASAQFNARMITAGGRYTGTNLEHQKSGLSLTASLQMVAWEARGGDTTLSSKWVIPSH
jgi:MAC/Perforin domain